MSNESKPKTGNMTEEEKRKIDAASKNLLLGKRDAAAKELQSMSKQSSPMPNDILRQNVSDIIRENTKVSGSLDIVITKLIEFFQKQQSSPIGDVEQRGINLTNMLKVKTELAIKEGSPYHETAEARTMAFNHGWEACQEYYNIPKTAAPNPTAVNVERELIDAFGRFMLLNDTRYETGRNADWGKLNFDEKVNKFFNEKSDYLPKAAAPKADPQEKTFSLNDMLECWEAGYQHCLIGAKNAEKYFKEKHGIDLNQKP